MPTAPTVQAAGTFKLGRWQVHRIGYGAMQLAGDNVFGPPRDRDEALRVLRAAVDSGINHLDTAQYYGPGVVNELIREALYPYPSDLAIVTKVAARRDDSGAVLRHDDPDQLRAGIEENLETLGTDRLAAVNLRLMDGHRPGERFDRQVAALVRAREDGLVDGIGLSNISIAHLRRALDQTEIVCVQNLFNLADQRSLELLQECRSHGIAFVPFCPLGWPRGGQNTILTSPVLAHLGARLVATPAQLALAWLLDLAPNVLLIPGTRTRGTSLKTSNPPALTSTTTHAPNWHGTSPSWSLTDGPPQPAAKRVRGGEMVRRTYARTVADRVIPVNPASHTAGGVDRRSVPEAQR